MIKMKLTEDNNDSKTLGQAIDSAEKILDDPEVYSDSGDIEIALDEALKANLREIRYGGKNFQNLLFIGEAGTGKTSRIEAWAKKNNINLVKILAATMDETDLSGILTADVAKMVAAKLATTEFDELGDIPRSVLFLDEWNRAPTTVRATLLNLIQSHQVPDPRVRGHMRFLPNFLFTVAAVNPKRGNKYNTQELDQAELGRVLSIPVANDPRGWLNYTRRDLNSKIKKAEDLLTKTTDAEMVELVKEDLRVYKGQLGIAEKLMTDPRGVTLFDTITDMQEADDNYDPDDPTHSGGNGLYVNSRNMTKLLNACNGTKDDFLKKWNSACNSAKKRTAEEILKDYQDVDDKANEVLKAGTDSEVFTSKKSKLDALKNKLKA